MAKTAAELLDEEPTASQLLDAEGEPPAQKLTEHDGVKRLDLHKTAPDLSEPEAAPEEDKPGLLKQIAKAVGVPTEFKDLAPETTVGAFGHGVQKGATLGFGDEITGLLEADAKQAEQRNKMLESVAEAKRIGTYDPAAAAPDIPGVTSYQLKRPGQPTLTKTAVAKSPTETESAEPMPWGAAYRQARDSMREQYKTAEKAHPYAFAGGEVLGGAAVPLPGVGKAKGLAKVGKYALQGAGLGATAGLGASEAELADPSHLNVSGAAGDTARGLAGGAAFGAGLGGVAAKLDPWLERMSARKAFKALDPYMETIRKELGPDATKGEILAEAEKLGRRSLDEGVIPAGPFGRWANSEQLAENALGKSEEAGQLKGAFVDHAQDELQKAGLANPVSLGRLATQVEQEAEAAKLQGNQDLGRKLMRKARDLRQTIVDRSSAGFADPAAQTLQDAEKFKTGLQKQIDYGAKLPNREAQTAVARLAKEQAEKAIEGGLGPEELDQFKALKNRYGELKSISNIANHGAVRDFRNNAVGLGDKLAAQVGAASAAGGPGAVAGAALAGGAHHFANHRGAAGLARSLRNAANRTSVALTPGAEYLAEPDDELKPQPWQSMRGDH